MSEELQWSRALIGPVLYLVEMEILTPNLITNQVTIETTSSLWLPDKPGDC